MQIQTSNDESHKTFDNFGVMGCEWLFNLLDIYLVLYIYCIVFRYTLRVYWTASNFHRTTILWQYHRFCRIFFLKVVKYFKKIKNVPDPTDCFYVREMRRSSSLSYQLRKNTGLTHFMPLVSLCTPWKHQKTRCFQIFSGVLYRTLIVGGGGIIKGSGGFSSNF